MSDPPKSYKRKNLRLKLAPLYEESIYDLLKKEVVKPKRRKMYRSKYPHNMAPSYSTFGIHTTSQPGLINGGGYFSRFQTRKIFRNKHGNFGKPPG